MNQRKKSKFRRRINRMKNKIQYLRKRVGVPVTCFLLCFSLISVTLFSTKQQAYATGVEEMLYYTYWDLISGLFAETGYNYSVKNEYYTSPNRASGEQIWDNFCTWVENKAKALSLPVAVVHDELKNLPNVVTQAGVTMSEKLAEILAKVLPTAVDDTSNGNQFDCSSKKKVNDMIYSITGGYLDDMRLGTIVDNGALLNIIYDSGKYYVYIDNVSFNGPNYLKIVQEDNGSYRVYYKYRENWYRPGQTGGSVIENGKTFYDMTITSFTSDMQWVIKNGAFAGADGIAQSDYARVKVKEKTDEKDGVYIPGVGWKTSWDLWRDQVNDRVTTDAEDEAWNSRYKFDNDDDDKKKQKKEDNNKDKLPVVLPIPFKPGKDTEKDTEKETESEKDTQPAPGPIPKPNPTEDGSEDDTETKKHIQDVITNAGGSSGGNWKKLFPFCIPWDIMTLIKSMNAEKKAPHFKYEHTFKGINYTFSIDVDMSDYWKYIKIFRWGMTIFFIIGLFFLTVKFTTFVHRGS